MQCASKTIEEYYVAPPGIYILFITMNLMFYMFVI